MDKARPFNISKREVWLAYKRVRENRGAAGVDDQTIAEFEKDLSNNLYRLWNRMSSGSYMPPPVRRVDIPKGDGRGTRSLGIPTVSDRIAQMESSDILSPSWNQCSTMTPLDIVPVGRRMMRWLRHGRDAGALTGCSISTSKASSTTSTGSY